MAFQRLPPLSDEAITCLKYGGGLETFKEIYGDYYVAGYHLGADTGLMLSEGRTTSSTVERLSAKVTVTVLFCEEEHTEEKFFTESSSDSTFQISAFDTLEDLHLSEVRIGAEGLENLRKSAADIQSMAARLSSRVASKIEQVGLPEGERLNLEICKKLSKSGLVVQLILLPVETLREVVLWSLSDDII